MELIYAILMFFGLLSPEQCPQMPSAYYQTIIQNNSQLIEFYQARPDELIRTAATIEEVDD